MKLNHRIFSTPTAEFRSAPFWSWNDKLEPQELVRQIKEMKQQGIGGFFMHTRIGLITPYLSKEYMTCIRTAVKAAKDNKMLAWLYDEDRWPSGFAGGIVPKLNKDFRMKGLWYDTKNKRFKVLTMKMGIPWFNDACYTDTLNPKAIKAFIKSTHDAYTRVCGSEYGKVIPGIFTDEPNYFYDTFSKPSIPWTTGLRKYFKHKNGYDLQPHLISLFENKGNYHQIRFDYRKTVTSLFVEAYTKQIYDWCDKYGIQSTGHMICEDNLLMQTQWIGAAMPHYEYMQQPGIDHLNLNINDLITAKQVSSVANQLGRKRILSELFGCSGQNMKFLDRKWIADWHYLNGINFMTEHLCLYSMKGRRKRDYPPNLYYQQPWWKYNRYIQDYFARLSYVLSQGDRVNSVLVLHPIGSVWSVYTPMDEKPVETYNKPFIELSENLLAAKWDYDYGDETIIAKYGKVEGNQFCIGQQKYAAVIIPPSLSWEKKTVALLSQFLAGGGKVIKIAPYPTLINGIKDKAITPVLDQAVISSIDSDKIDQVLTKLIRKDVQVFDAKGNNIPEIWYHHRQIEDADFYFLANTNHDQGFEAIVELAKSGTWELWDTLTGDVVPLEAKPSNGKSQFKLSFMPAGSYLLCCHPNSGKSSGAKVSSAIPQNKIVSKVKLAPEWDYIRENENALTLDYCRYQLKSGPWSQQEPTMKVFELIRQQKIGTPFKIQYTFNLGFQPNPKQRVWLVLESPEKYRISINGKPISALQKKEFWYDISFKKLEITKVINLGQNIIEIAGITEKESEIESCYIIGDFAVKSNDHTTFQLVPEKPILRSGNWIDQGYPFYAGSFKVQQEIALKIKAKQRVFLEFDQVNATACEVWINNKKVTTWYWSPFSVEITQYLKKQGKNKITLKLVNSLRNLLGPHHHIKGELTSVGPGSFRDWKNWTDTYCFVPFGVSAGKIVISK
ncbi:MAG: glycosyl hydrolase [bacterium]